MNIQTFIVLYITRKLYFNMRKKEEKEKAISLDICFAILSPQVVFLMKIAFMFALPQSSLIGSMTNKVRLFSVLFI